MTNNVINSNYYNQIAALNSPSVNSSSSSASNFSNLLQNAVDTNDKKQTGGSSLNDIFARAAEQYNVPANLLKAVAKNESNFNANAVSSCGAQGVMQLMPSTAKSLGVQNPLDAEQNITGGAKYLSQMLDRYDGDTTLALAAYNAGSGNVAKYGGVPPFKETQTYIARVLKDAGVNITTPTTQLPSLSSVLGSSLSSSFGSNDFGSSKTSSLNSSLASLLGSSQSSSLNSSLASLLGSSQSSSLNSSLASLLGSSQSSDLSSSLASLLESSLSSSNSVSGGSTDSSLGNSSSYTYDDYISYLQLYIAQMQSNSTQPLASDLTGLTNSEML